MPPTGATSATVGGYSESVLSLVVHQVGSKLNFSEALLNCLAWLKCFESGWLLHSVPKDVEKPMGAEMGIQQPIKSHLYREASECERN